MKIIITLFCIALSTLLYCNEMLENNIRTMCKNKNDSLSLYPDIENFISKVKTERNKFSAHFIYYLKVLRSDSTCVMYNLGIIVNESELELIKSDYFTRIDGEWIIILHGDEVIEPEVQGLTLSRFSLEQQLEVKEKLIQEKDGFAMVVFPGMVFLICEDKTIQKRYYENSDFVPREISIFKDFMDKIELRKIND